ncbi:DUF3107 domain-containing protein [Aquipuribacter nitratireducens]|uniref:DUF3107 domain-containing protein n=1 Tax=Aquipuribacter nitratireducens TaxID=650104 RepID=A0ABW0GP09_9MICO
MQVKIGVRNAPREIVLETEKSPEEISKAVAAALSGPVLELVDDKGRRVIVPTEALAYVETGATEVRSVGFGTTGA